MVQTRRKARQGHLSAATSQALTAIAPWWNPPWPHTWQRTYQRRNSGRRQTRVQA
ncbi:hypothetical protein ACFVTP_15775 [Streptomyces celluloflavus]|uniref:hypothetical protein n=1 Tax=Streptomyces celluloflavus TaxID=58344 RepID=UPI0036DB5AC7